MTTCCNCLDKEGLYQVNGAALCAMCRFVILNTVTREEFLERCEMYLTRKDLHERFDHVVERVRDGWRLTPRVSRIYNANGITYDWIRGDVQEPSWKTPMSLQTLMVNVGVYEIIDMYIQ